MSGRERRDERVPLDALVELRSEDGDDVLEADGLDLSLGGLSLRAPFVPEAGARLLCYFRCPPSGEPVEARGEVVWSEWEGPRSGAFGLRFLELDTRSAKAIRALVDPASDTTEPEPEPAPAPRAATMVIDGLGAPIEADLRLFEETHVVLEQELTFLKLGRGVEVDVPGRGKQRGRIASVELRHGPLDVLTLVFGVLVDEVRAAEPVVAQRVAMTPSARALAQQAEPSRPKHDAEVSELPVAEAPSLLDTWPERPMFVEEAKPDAIAEPSVVAARHETTASESKSHSVARAKDETRTFAVQADEAREAEQALSDEERAEVSDFAPAQAKLKALHRTWTTLMLLARARLLPTLRTFVTTLRTLLERHMPEAKGRLVTAGAKLSALVSAQRARLAELKQARAQKLTQRTTSPAPRAQKAPKIVKREAQKAPETPKRALPRNQRLWALGLAAVGIALGVYALAPRSEAKPAELSLTPQVLDGAAQLPSATADEPPGAQPALDLKSAHVTANADVATAQVGVGSPLPTLGSAPTQAQLGATNTAPSQDQAAALPTAIGQEPALARVFGAPSVTDGRTFALRMSGPVEGLEGESREDGFTVRVPGRLALDRASPIATSHRAVARAMILNRGDYAELTVDFLPGMRPKYQVVAKDASIEVTLERQ